MKRIPIALLFLLFVTNGIPAHAQQTDEQRAAEASKLTLQEISRFELRSGIGENAVLLERSKASILRWSNPSQGTLFGDVYIWTTDGRPEAVASVLKHYSPYTHMSAEFQSLSPGHLTMTAKSDGHIVWRPRQAGLEMIPLTDAPKPAGAKFSRLRQMRSLVGDFTVDATDRKQNSVTRRLRLLTQPLFRYDSHDEQVLDGALFAFVEGTDPELFVLIEARKTDGGYVWNYGLGRMNSIKMVVSRKGKTVWEGKKLAPPWSNVHKPEGVYFHIGLGEVQLDPTPDNNKATDSSATQSNSGSNDI